MDAMEESGDRHEIDLCMNRHRAYIYHDFGSPYNMHAKARKQEDDL
jgi:hypothetical protein